MQSYQLSIILKIKQTLVIFLSCHTSMIFHNSFLLLFIPLFFLNFIFFFSFLLFHRSLRQVFHFISFLGLRQQLYSLTLIVFVVVRDYEVQSLCCWGITFTFYLWLLLVGFLKSFGFFIWKWIWLNFAILLFLPLVLDRLQFHRFWSFCGIIHSCGACRCFVGDLVVADLTHWLMIWKLGFNLCYIIMLGLFPMISCFINNSLLNHILWIFCLDDHFFWIFDLRNRDQILQFLANLILDWGFYTSG